MPDLYSYLLGRRYFYPQNLPIALTPLGCTSIVGYEESSASRKVLHARNLDYPGGHEWTQFPALIEYLPDDGQRYVSVTSLGVHTAGITSMNEAGLTLALHMNYSRYVSTAGMPIVAMGQEVIRQATTLQEAISLLQTFPKGAGWSFVLTSHREQSAAIIEFDAKHFSVQRINGQSLCRTNHFQSATLAKGEYWISYGRRLDSLERAQRAANLLSSAKPSIRVDEMAHFLADSYGPSGDQERAFCGTICQPHTVSSVIFDAARKRIFLAGGSSPVSKNLFIAYECFPGPTEYNNQILPSPPTTPKEAARKEYVTAFYHYFPQTDLSKVSASLKKCRELDSNEELYTIMLGWVEAKRGNLEEALALMKTGQEITQSPYRKGQISLFQGRLLDLLGKREEAMLIYQSLLTDPIWRKLARKGLRHAWQKKKVQRLFLDFMVGEPIDPV